MQFAFRQPAKVWLSGLLLLTALYLAAVTAQFAAARLSQHVKPANLEWAMRLDPLNAQYRYRLGEYALLQEQSPRDALPWFAKASALNPHRSEYWLAQALASQSLGNLTAEQSSLERALAVDPHTPEVVWQAANLFLAQGSQDLAMKEFREVMQNSPTLTGPAIQICWKVHPDADFLLSNVIPPPAYRAFLDFLISRNEDAAAARVWDVIVAARQKIERASLFDYLRHLIANRETPQAVAVWQQAAGLANLEAYQPSSENLIINGNFSLEVLNGGFDWLHRKTPGVSLALDPNEAHAGQRSLRITFDGAGIEDAGIRQLVPLAPNTTYDFSAFYKAQDMDGAGGVRFMIQDLYRETNLFTTDDLTDADFWKKVGGRFTTDSETHLAVLRIARVPAGSPIRGRMWIDGLQLVTPPATGASGSGGSR